MSLCFCHHPPPEPSEVLQVRAVWINRNPYTEPGQLLPSHARSGRTRQPRRAAAAPAPGTARSSVRSRRPAPSTAALCTPTEAPGLSAVPVPCSGTSPCSPYGTGRGRCSPDGAVPRREAALLPPHPHLLHATAGGPGPGPGPRSQPGSGGAPGRSPAPGPPAYAAEIPSKAITKPVWGRRRGFVFDSFYRQLYPSFPTK